MKRHAPGPSRREFVSAVGCGLAVAAVGPLGLSADEPSRYPIIGFTKPFQTLNFEETADTVAEIGWDGVECPVRVKGQIEPERAPDELPRLAAALQKRGKVIGLLTTNITRADDPQTLPVLRTAVSLGIKRYRLGSWKYDLKKSIPDQLNEVKAALRDLADLNHELGIQGGFQNHSGRDVVGAPVWDQWTALKELDGQRMGVCFDIGHATIEGGLSWPIEARLMQPRFAAVYVKDFIWQRSERGWRLEWVMLGEGMVDRGFFKWLKTTDYAGPISQHHEYDHGSGPPMMAKMKKDLRVLREWLAMA